MKKLERNHDMSMFFQQKSKYGGTVRILIHRELFLCWSFSTYNFFLLQRFIKKITFVIFGDVMLNFNFFSQTTGKS